MNQWIYSFDSDINDLGDPAKLIGNKGVSLSLMTSLGLPVPEGFTITTDLNHYFQKHDKFPSGFNEELNKNIKIVEKSSSAIFGSSKNPLLFSVRSGSQRSMPGMLDTVLNVGFNRDVLDFFENKGLSLFAWDTWRRFLHMFSHVVYKIEHFYFDEILDSYLLGAGLQFEKDLEVNDIKEICDQYLNLIEEKIGSPFPENVNDQLWLAIKAVMNSWFNERAIDYRKINSIPEDIGTAVNIQKMVFGNFDENSALGLRTAFDDSHDVAYGYSRSDEPVELVGMRVELVKVLSKPPFLPRKTAGRPKRLGDDPALGFAGIFRTGIAADRGAPHEALMLRRVEPGGRCGSKSGCRRLRDRPCPNRVHRRIRTSYNAPSTHKVISSLRRRAQAPCRRRDHQSNPFAQLRKDRANSPPFPDGCGRWFGAVPNTGFCMNSNQPVDPGFHL